MNISIGAKLIFDKTQHFFITKVRRARGKIP